MDLSLPPTGPSLGIYRFHSHRKIFPEKFTLIPKSNGEIRSDAGDDLRRTYVLPRRR